MALINRQKYLDSALLFLDTDLVKVVTGIRRCGKSTLLKLVENHLRDRGKVDAQFVTLNLESKNIPVANEDELYLYFKERLFTEGKTYIYYIVDTGIRSFMLGYRNNDYGRVFENIVYLQLLYYGFDVNVGKLYEKEVDFIALKEGRQIYIQVADSIFDDATKERELDPLRSIREAYEKCVIVRRGSYPAEIDGIKIISAQDFLLNADDAW